MDSPLMPLFAHPAEIFERGEGPYLYTDKGERYLDFIGGIAVSAFGYGRPEIVSALKAQADKVWHVSNLFKVRGQIELGQRFADATFAEKLTGQMESWLRDARRRRGKVLGPRGSSRMVEGIERGLLLLPFLVAL